MEGGALAVGGVAHHFRIAHLLAGIGRHGGVAHLGGAADRLAVTQPLARGGLAVAIAAGHGVQALASLHLGIARDAWCRHLGGRGGIDHRYFRTVEGLDLAGTRVVHAFAVDDLLADVGFHRGVAGGIAVADLDAVAQAEAFEGHAVLIGTRDAGDGHAHHQRLVGRRKARCHRHRGGRGRGRSRLLGSRGRARSRHHGLGGLGAGSDHRHFGTVDGDHFTGARVAHTLAIHQHLADVSGHRRIGGLLAVLDRLAVTQTEALEGLAAIIFARHAGHGLAHPDRATGRAEGRRLAGDGRRGADHRHRGALGPDFFAGAGVDDTLAVDQLLADIGSRRGVGGLLAIGDFLAADVEALAFHGLTVAILTHHAGDGLADADRLTGRAEGRGLQDGRLGGSGLDGLGHLVGVKLRNVAFGRLTHTSSRFIGRVEECARQAFFLLAARCRSAALLALAAAATAGSQQASAQEQRGQRPRLGGEHAVQER